MKKIVALVLTLVLALSLATVAFGAQKTTTYEGLSGKYVNGTSVATDGSIKLSVTTGKAPKYDEDGNKTADGEVEYATVMQGTSPVGTKFVVVDSLKDATLVLYADNACKVVKFYLKEVNTQEYGEGVLFTNFGKKCGQVNFDYDKDTQYFTVKGEGFAVYEADENGTENVMYKGALVAVNATPVATTKVAHNPVFESKNGDIISVTCGKCGLVAIEAANVLSLPTDADVVVGTTTWYWPATAAAAEGVTSAKTFDAGVALYAGMALMSVAGSAVVIGKKKEF